MELVEMTMDELLVIDGGGWKQAVQVFSGTVAIAVAVPVSVVNPGAGLVLACLDAGLK